VIGKIRHVKVKGLVCLLEGNMDYTPPLFFGVYEENIRKDSWKRRGRPPKS
jgi:hypothetical protein